MLKFRVSGCLFVACLQLEMFVFVQNYNSCPDDPQTLSHTQNQQDRHVLFMMITLSAAIPLPAHFPQSFRFPKMFIYSSL